MKDYHITLTVRNNYFIRAMSAAGVTSLSEISRATGVSGAQLSRFMTLKDTPMDKIRGGYRDTIKRIAKFLDTNPYDLFPPDHVIEPLADNKAVFELDREEVKEICHTEPQSPYKLLEQKEREQSLEAIIDTLAYREATILRQRYFEGMILEDIAKFHKVSRERVRQIELKALNRLRSSNRFHLWKQFKEIFIEDPIDC